MAAGLPPGLPPPTVPGLTAEPGPVGGSLMPPDALGSALGGLQSRQDSVSEMMRQVVSLLETVASLDPKMRDRAGAALALLRGPKQPGKSTLKD